MSELHPKQISGVGDFFVTRTPTDPRGQTIHQVITGQKTFVSGDADEDRSSEAPDTPGRFDSATDTAAVAVFGVEGINTATAGIGLWAGDDAPTGSLWWVPTTPYHQDYGYLSFRQSRGASGFSAQENDGVITGFAGVEGYFVLMPLGRKVGSPGLDVDNYISDDEALWPPPPGYAKLFCRPGPVAYGWSGSPDLEPSLAIASADLQGNTSVETVLTLEKATDVFSLKSDEKTLSVILPALSSGVYPIAVFPNDVELVSAQVISTGGSFTSQLEHGVSSPRLQTIPSPEETTISTPYSPTDLPISANLSVTAGRPLLFRLTAGSPAPTDLVVVIHYT